MYFLVNALNSIMDITDSHRALYSENFKSAISLCRTTDLLIYPPLCISIDIYCVKIDMGSGCAYMCLSTCLSLYMSVRVFSLISYSVYCHYKKM